MLRCLCVQLSPASLWHGSHEFFGPDFQPVLKRPCTPNDDSNFSGSLGNKASGLGFRVQGLLPKLLAWLCTDSMRKCVFCLSWCRQTRVWACIRWETLKTHAWALEQKWQAPDLCFRPLLAMSVGTGLVPKQRPYVSPTPNPRAIQNLT